MFGLGMSEITVVLVLALIFLGPKVLPELASGLGKIIREVRKATVDIKNEIQLDETIRKPLEELREATMLPPEELKRRDEERALREKWEKDEQERLAREEEERKKVAGTEPTVGIGDDTLAGALHTPPVPPSDRTIAMESPPQPTPEPEMLESGAIDVTAAPKSPLPSPASAPSKPRAPTPPPPLPRPPLGAVPRGGAAGGTGNATMIGVGTGGMLPGANRAPTPPPPAPGSPLASVPSGPRLPPPPASARLPGKSAPVPAPAPTDDDKKA